MRSFILGAFVLAICIPRALAREWTDFTGAHTVEAEFADLKDGKVLLKKGDGRTITIPLDKLSSADQNFVVARYGKVETVVRDLRDKLAAARASVAREVRKMNDRLEKESSSQIATEDRKSVEQAEGNLQRMQEVASRLGKPAGGPPTRGVRDEVTIAVSTSVTMPDGSQTTVLITLQNAKAILKRFSMVLAREKQKARANAVVQAKAKHREELARFDELRQKLAEAEKLLPSVAAMDQRREDPSHLLAEIAKCRHQVQEAVALVAAELDK